MSGLDLIADTLFNLDLDNEIANMTEFKTVVLNSDLTIDSPGLDKTGANRKHGIYIHYTNDTCMYVGKAERQTIAARQTSHFTSFRKPHNTNERTGKKYREYMTKNEINSMELKILYLDMSKYPRYMIPMLEVMIMDHLEPVLNQETQEI